LIVHGRSAANKDTLVNTPISYSKQPRAFLEIMRQPAAIPILPSDHNPHPAPD